MSTTMARLQSASSLILITALCLTTRRKRSITWIRALRVEDRVPSAAKSREAITTIKLTQKASTMAKMLKTKMWSRTWSWVLTKKVSTPNRQTAQTTSLVTSNHTSRNRHSSQINLHLRPSQFTTHKTICRTNRSKLPRETSKRRLPNADALTSSPLPLGKTRTTTQMRDTSKWQQGEQPRSKSLNLSRATSWGPRSGSSTGLTTSRLRESSKRLQVLKRANSKGRLKLATISILDKVSIQTKVNCLRMSYPPSSLLSASQVT